jgi:CheY-like chemotaxis protein
MRQNMSTQPTILLVDDDPEDQEIFSMILEQITAKVRFLCSDNGVNALKLLTAEQDLSPEIIFMDMNMPLMDGMQCLAEMRKSLKLKEVPIYMYSTSAQDSIVAECRRLGANGFLKKVANLSDFENSLKTILGSHLTAI